MKRLLMYYTDRQGKKWELREVRASEVVPQFIHAIGGEEGTALHLHVGDVRLGVVDAPAP